MHESSSQSSLLKWILRIINSMDYVSGHHASSCAADTGHLAPKYIIQNRSMDTLQQGLFVKQYQNCANPGKAYDA